METKTYNVYKFSELSKNSKEKAVNDLRYINVEDRDWQDMLFAEEWYPKLVKLGYYGSKIFYSGFGSQGDGACFTARVDLDLYLATHKLANKFKTLAKYNELVDIRINHSSRYYFSTSTSVDYDIISSDETAIGNTWYKIDEEIQALQIIIENERKDLGNSLYRDLEKLYEELTSDQSIVGTIEMNDYNFTEKGEIDPNL